MEKPIMIQGALQSEIDYLLNIFDVREKVEFGGYTFYECSYKDHDIVICKTKMGEISSAIATTLGIQKYNPEFIINQGTAGALVESINKNEIVVGTSVYYISQFSTDENKEVEDINPWKKDEYRTIDGEVISYKANEELINKLKGLECLKSAGIHFDVIGSGDVWTKDFETMNKNNKRHGVVCEAMECTGAYMAANSLKTPLVSIRVISNNEIKGQEYDPETGITSQKVIVKILDEMF